MKFLRLVLCAFGILFVAAHAEALTLYASTAAGTTGELYILNSTTGAVVQDVGPLNDLNNVNYPITGLAFQPHTGILLGSTGNSSATTAASLVKINPVNGQVLVIGPFNAGPVNSSGTPATMTDLAFDSAGILYGIGSIGGPNLYTINTSTGQATLVGSNGALTSTSGGGLAISSAGVFYGTPTSSRYGTYNSSTGAYTDIANPAKPAGTGAYTALDYNGSLLYGLNTGPGSSPPTHIVTIDPTTGTVTDLGSSLNSLDAIAFQPAAVLAGDYNNNGVVEAGDYVVYRKNAGTTNILLNDPIGGTIGLAQYTQWRSNFGKPPGSGVSTGDVPEPTALMLLVAGMLATCIHRGRQSLFVS